MQSYEVTHRMALTHLSPQSHYMIRTAVCEVASLGNDIYGEVINTVWPEILSGRYFGGLLKL